MPVPIIVFSLPLFPLLVLVCTIPIIVFSLPLFPLLFSVCHCSHYCF
jgi:hypothetical protein